MNKAQTYNIAIVVDPIYKYGPSERYLQYILEIFPESTLFTAHYDKDFVKEYFPNIEIRNSFLQYLPFKDKFKKFYSLLLSFAYKTLNLKSYDAVLSISTSFSKHVNGNIHINMCIASPLEFTEFGIFNSLLNKSDKSITKKIDGVIAISNVVKERLDKYYDIKSDVIYPPVRVKEIEKETKGINKENWFLYLGRIEKEKGVELVIRAAVESKTPIKIAGIGDDLTTMKDLVKELNAKGYVKFLGFVSEQEKLQLLAKAKALVFPVKNEDFGTVPVEANAAGTPVIAYKQGGVLETLSDSNPKTGIFFNKYDYKELAKILKKFDSKMYKEDNCRKQAENFAVEIFKYKLKTYVEDILRKNKDV